MDEPDGYGQTADSGQEGNGRYCQGHSWLSMRMVSPEFFRNVYRGKDPKITICPVTVLRRHANLFRLNFCLGGGNYDCHIDLLKVSVNLAVISPRAGPF